MCNQSQNIQILKKTVCRLHYLCFWQSKAPRTPGLPNSEFLESAWTGLRDTMIPPPVPPKPQTPPNYCPTYPKIFKTACKWNQSPNLHNRSLSTQTGLHDAIPVSGSAQTQVAQHACPTYVKLSKMVSKGKQSANLQNRSLSTPTGLKDAMPPRLPSAQTPNVTKRLSDLSQNL